MKKNKSHNNYKYKLKVFGSEVMAKIAPINPAIYNYFNANKLSLREFIEDEAYAEEKAIPPEMWPFAPGIGMDSVCGDNIIEHSGYDDLSIILIDEQGHETSIDPSDINYTHDTESSWTLPSNISKKFPYVREKNAPDEAIFVMEDWGDYFEEVELELPEPFDPGKLEGTFIMSYSGEINNISKYHGEKLLFDGEGSGSWSQVF